MKLFFRKSGEGKPLIILHGLFGMSDNWMTLSKQFAASGFLVYAVDARNHGRSPHSDSFSYSLMSEDLLELLESEKIASASVIGHSMGGKTGMWFACEHPDRISRFICADIAPHAYTPHHQSVFAAIHSVKLDQNSSRKEAEAQISETLKDEGTIQFLLKNLYWDEEDKLAWRFHLNGIEKNDDGIGEALPDSYKYTGPALFMRGEKSGYITDADTVDIKKHFPAATIKTISNAGHWIHAENPDEFYQAAISFLQ